MTDLPPYLRPFVLPVADAGEVRVERVGHVDLYHPAGTARTGAILLVHGGPMPADLEVLPREWPVFQGYATAAAQRGLVAAVVEHGLIRGLDQLLTAADDVEAAVGVLRADPRVDPGRVALWFFSGGGLLAGEWLDSRPDWLRCLMLTYPMLATPPGVDELVNAAEVIGKQKDKDLPVLLTRVGRERAELAGPVAEFVSAGGAALDIIDVPKGQHGFDMLDHTEESRAAVTKALDWAIAHLGEDPTATSTLPIPTPTETSKVSPAGSPAKKTTTAPRRPTPAPKAAAVVETAKSPTPTPVAEKSSTSIPSVAPDLTAVVATAFSFETPATRVVEREHATYAAHDLEAFLALYSPTAQLQFADGAVLRGRRSLREYYQPLFDAGKCKTELQQRMMLGEWVVEQSVRHDTDQGPVPTIVMYRVQDGLIVEVRFLA
ncbi:nuclear transport factor 2 family protein [Kribbella italica]|uniref:Dienelactone hydrolase n=1 Tax=Kribbella italica TaxID=1540520 RepID=A0A7W9MWE3_9ACTN|nr:nuclear transport factor 2 family protein [Kribbella italica]MBB5838187.1 dienelactone hydrolase [Kribbella italica]